jgi:hypothetical protein
MTQRQLRRAKLHAGGFESLVTVGNGVWRSDDLVVVRIQIRFAPNAFRCG